MTRHGSVAHPILYAPDQPDVLDPVRSLHPVYTYPLSRGGTMPTDLLLASGVLYILVQLTEAVVALAIWLFLDRD